MRLSFSSPDPVVDIDDYRAKHTQGELAKMVVERLGTTYGHAIREVKRRTHKNSINEYMAAVLLRPLFKSGDIITCPTCFSKDHPTCLPKRLKKNKYK